MILLIEDNPDDVFIVQRAMRNLDLPPLHVVVNGRDALDYLEGVGDYGDRTAHPLPELIFLDLKLPFINGFEVLERIRTQSWFTNVPVIILSSSVEESDRERARQLGARKFLVKPPTPDVLAITYRLFVTDGSTSS